MARQLSTTAEVPEQRVFWKLGFGAVLLAMQAPPSCSRRSSAEVDRANGREAPRGQASLQGRSVSTRPYCCRRDRPEPARYGMVVATNAAPIRSGQRSASQASRMPRLTASKGSARSVRGRHRSARWPAAAEGDDMEALWPLDVAEGMVEVFGARAATEAATFAAEAAMLGDLASTMLWLEVAQRIRALAACDFDLLPGGPG